MESIALKNTKQNILALNASLALVLNLTPYAGIVVPCIANGVALKMPWCVSVECLSSLPLYNIYAPVLTMCG